MSTMGITEQQAVLEIKGRNPQEIDVYLGPPLMPRLKMDGYDYDDSNNALAALCQKKAEESWTSYLENYRRPYVAPKSLWTRLFLKVRSYVGL